MDPLLLALVTASLTLSIASLILSTKMVVKLRRLMVICRAYAKIGREAAKGKARRRYIVFKVLAEDRLTKDAVWGSIRGFIMSNIGEIGFVKANPELIYFDEDIQSGVLRVVHTYSKLVAGLISLIKDIDGKKCLIVPLKTTGTLRKARKTMYALTERKTG